MIGAVVGLGVLNVDRKVFETAIRDGIQASRIEANLLAFDIGVSAVSGAANPGG
jgi:Pyruvate/2-oxoacid:ferredoxin oxidoreductase gamma subunit